MVVRVGLTGSIGMGKSTTASFFEEEGAAVWDADAAVHRIYEKGGRGPEAIYPLVPEAIVDGTVNRERLREAISNDPKMLPLIESVIHPLVRQDRETFSRDAQADILVFDVPLLFETEAEDEFDHIVVVSAPPELQRERVLSRGRMSEAEFEQFLARQIPDAQKRARADTVIVTDTLEHARSHVQTLVQKLRGP